MSLRTAQTITLLFATVTTGLMAGLFFAYANSVMPALHRSSDKTFVEAMRNINKVIQNPLFMTAFMGALLALGVALYLDVRTGRTLLPWLIAAAVLYGVMFLVTSAVNVPLNNDLERAGAHHLGTLADARRHFETRWVAWNTVRTVANVGAFVVLLWALVLHGRATSTNTDADAASGPHRTAAATSPHTRP